MEINSTSHQLSSALDDIQWLISNEYNELKSSYDTSEDSNEVIENSPSPLAYDENLKSIKHFLESGASHLHLDAEIKSVTESSSSDIIQRSKYESLVHVRDCEMDQYHPFPQLPSEWNFDNIYEDVNSDNSFYSQ